MESIQIRCGEFQAVAARVKAREMYLTKSKHSQRLPHCGSDLFPSVISRITVDKIWHKLFGRENLCN